MDLMGTPERQRFWEDLAGEHLENQKKARRERDRLKRLQPVVERDLAAATVPVLKTYLEIQQRLLEIYLAQIEEFNPDTDVWAIEPAMLARAEWCLIESQWLTLRQDAMNFARLASILAEDWDAALAGEPPAHRYPSAWMALRPTLPGSPEWQGVLAAFREGQPELEAAVTAAMPLMEALADRPLPEKLNEAKAVNVPALRGVQYRLEAPFRKLPDGEAFLDGMRLYQLRDPGEGAAPEPGARKRSLTDRMLGFLKKP